MKCDNYLQPKKYHVNAQDHCGEDMSTRATRNNSCNANTEDEDSIHDLRDLHVSPLQYVALDSMSNLPLVPQNVIEHLGMTRSTLKVPVHFGAVSHDGTVAVTEVAITSNDFLPAFYVAPTGYMSILPTSYLSRMGYEIVILSNELGFMIQDNDGHVIHRGIQHRDKFHYLPWDFLLSLKPTNVEIEYQVNDANCIGDVCMELDNIFHWSRTCNSTTV